MVWPKSNTQIIDRDRMYVCVCWQLSELLCSWAEFSFICLPVWHVCLIFFGQNDLPNHRECSAWIFMACHADQEFIFGIYICSCYALKYFTIYYIFFHYLKLYIKWLQVMISESKCDYVMQFLMELLRRWLLLGLWKERDKHR